MLGPLGAVPVLLVKPRISVVTPVPATPAPNTVEPVCGCRFVVELNVGFDEIEAESLPVEPEVAVMNAASVVASTGVATLLADAEVANEPAVPKVEVK